MSTKNKLLATEEFSAEACEIMKVDESTVHSSKDEIEGQEMPQNSVENLIPFADDEEFLKELQKVVEEDYGVTLYTQDLKESGENLNSWLQNML